MKTNRPDIGIKDYQSRMCFAFYMAVPINSTVTLKILKKAVKAYHVETLLLIRSKKLSNVGLGQYLVTAS